MTKPYTEFYVWENLRIRNFVGVNELELIWHKDKKDRLCAVVAGENWKYQIDDEFPIELQVGDTFFIPKEIYHRLIKGKTDLTLIIKEFEDESTDENSQFYNEADDKTHTRVHTV